MRAPPGPEVHVGAPIQERENTNFNLQFRQAAYRCDAQQAPPCGADRLWRSTRTGSASASPMSCFPPTRPYKDEVGAIFENVQRHLQGVHSVPLQVGAAAVTAPTSRRHLAYTHKGNICRTGIWRNATSCERTAVATVPSAQ